MNEFNPLDKKNPIHEPISTTQEGSSGPAKASQPGSLTRQFHAGKVHRAQTLHAITHTGSNKAAHQMVQRLLESKAAPPNHDPNQRKANQILQRSFTDTQNLNFSTDMPLNTLPADSDITEVSPTDTFGSTNTPNPIGSGISNNFQAPATITDPYANYHLGTLSVGKIRGLSDKDFATLEQLTHGTIPADIRNPVGHSTNPAGSNAAPQTSPSPGANSLGSGKTFNPTDENITAGGNQSFANQFQFIPFNQLPPLALPPGINVDGVVADPKIPGGGSIVVGGQVQFRVVLSPAGLNGFPSGTVFSADWTQVVGGNNVTGGNNTVMGNTPGATPIATPPPTSPVNAPANGTATTSLTNPSAGGPPPATIGGYDPGSLLSQLPPGASIKLSEGPFGTVVGANQKEKYLVTLSEVNGLPAGTLLSLKFPGQVVGSLQPGASNNPFKQSPNPGPEIAPVPASSGSGKNQSQTASTQPKDVSDLNLTGGSPGDTLAGGSQGDYLPINSRPVPPPPDVSKIVPIPGAKDQLYLNRLQTTLHSAVEDYNQKLDKYESISPINDALTGAAKGAIGGAAATYAITKTPGGSAPLRDVPAAAGSVVVGAISGVGGGLISGVSSAFSKGQALDDVNAAWGKLYNTYIDVVKGGLPKAEAEANWADIKAGPPNSQLITPGLLPN